MSSGPSRRDVLKAGAAVGVGSLGVATAISNVAASHRDGIPDHVTVTYDEDLIKRYQPQLVLEGVEPQPLAYHALHAESSESTLNAVYGFVQYPYQEGNAGRSDSHLGDHEPVIVFYDQSTGDVVRVDYAAYHWFHGWAPADSFQYADADQRRPMLRVDKSYHHYYIYSGGFAGDRIQVENLLESIDGWLSNDLEDELALSQPFDPWAMLGRESWWKHTTMNWLDAFLKALWFNLGLSSATETADVQGVSTW